MRMLDQTTNKSVDNLTILLEEEEAVQLIGYLEELLSEGIQNEHYHLNNADCSKEITVALYDNNSLNNFSDRYKSLIVNDE